MVIRAAKRLLHGLGRSADLQVVLQAVRRAARVLLHHLPRLLVTTAVFGLADLREPRVDQGLLLGVGLGLGRLLITSGLVGVTPLLATASDPGLLVSHHVPRDATLLLRAARQLGAGHSHAWAVGVARRILVVGCLLLYRLRLGLDFLLLRKQLALPTRLLRLRLQLFELDLVIFLLADLLAHRHSQVHVDGVVADVAGNGVAHVVDLGHLNEEGHVLVEHAVLHVVVPREDGHAALGLQHVRRRRVVDNYHVLQITPQHAHIFREHALDEAAVLTEEALGAVALGVHLVHQRIRVLKAETARAGETGSMKFKSRSRYG